MNLREPKKKERVKFKLQSPFPVPMDGKGEWPIYTAHLTDMGSYIIEPEEMKAIHSNGFFGKGSLSRSHPSFGKARYGAPPVVRSRQWYRRQEWMKEVKELNSASASDYKDPKISLAQCDVESVSDSQEENTGDILEVSSNSTVDNESRQKNEVVMKNVTDDEVVLDSAEEDDVCVIVNKDPDKCDNAQNATHDNQSCQEEMEDVDELCDFDYCDFKDIDNCAKENEDLHGKLLVLPDSDSDTEDYFKDIKPKIENEGFPVREVLHLTFEETFFLLFGLGCLQLVHFDGNLLDISSAWRHFCKERPDFLQKYVVYHYYRSKGWVVKPGLKYGGDFVLYKQGPPFYHASYNVVVEVVDADSLQIDTDTTRSMTWNNLFGLARLSKTTGKELLFAQVLWPSSVSKNISMTSPNMLSDFTVREVLYRRWDPRKHRNDGPEDEEDDDS